MPIYRPNELFSFLAKENLAPKKGLSQNFLIDGNIIRKIVEEADVQAGDFIVEIGPGPGVLTEAMLDKGASVLAIEKDSGFADKLTRFQDKGRLTILNEDILEVDIAAEIKKMGVEGPLKVISNLPYHITTPIIVKLLAMGKAFSSIVVMVQEEVAQRFAGKPKTKEYGSITVFLSFFADVRYGFKVKRSCFMPQPKVDSAIVIFHPKDPPIQDEEQQTRFLHLVRLAFNQRRKTLRSALEREHEKALVVKALKQANFSDCARAEELSLDEFLLFYSSLLLVEKEQPEKPAS
ncbi:16S rRNA (adenine(1518)-N(6)/adenine(1519)-N(6))-dimethyltransferase RsmA [Estrella lausannensis]|uniref:Ribosomal RNA small subunit methyltransferase A n=1 Tax=Estrella lausannensis TaxID=483423 RepID=A0A0H5DNL0_9BACT|nr:16S rRNA (adenine(1518)-N(6)/adenine(1519)-N(6))-dimethyltransferase RsmA [Estrella lausannensis]CRX37832.1 Ribosomal RNA small subunit methyltransferase A [Estrella lausannensis]